MSLKFTEEHEWILIEGDIATIGITEHAQEQLGDLVFIELPEAGDELQKGEEVATIESVKAASEVYAAVSGEVTEANAAVIEDPSLVNRDSMGEGWFYKIKLSDPSETNDLMDKDAYDAMVA